MLRPYIMLVERNAMRHVAAELVDGLAAHCEPTFVCPTPLSDHIRSGARVIEVDFPAHKYYPSYFTKMATLVAQLRREKPDIIHFVDPTPALTLFQPLMKICPLVQEWHDINPHPGDSPGFFALNRRVCTKLVDAVVVHGEKLKTDLVSLYPDLEKKTFVVPLGTHRFFDGWDGDQDTQEEDNVLLFGRLRTYKGIDVFLKAAKLIHQQMPHVTFTLAGEGDITPYADLLSETRDYVEVDNRSIPDELVPKLFRRAKVISMPYIEGSASGVLGVAHGFAKPSIVTSVGSITEYVEPDITDVVIPPGDHIALAEATMKLLKDDAFRTDKLSIVQAVNYRNTCALNCRQDGRRELMVDVMAVGDIRAGLGDQGSDISLSLD